MNRCIWFDMTSQSVLALILGASMFATFVRADTFGSGANSFEIDFVSIGNPGNPEDTTGNPNPAGAVGYEYRIGKYEISEQMIDKANTLGGLGITKITRGPDKPATSIHWLEAMRFANWLNTSAGCLPAYKFDTNGAAQLWAPSDPGYDLNNPRRNSLAKYFLPTVDEWYKAAYYDPSSGTYFDYPTGSSTPPIAIASGTAPGTAVYFQLPSMGPADITLAGGLSPYGTMAQGGNGEYEWQESQTLIPPFRGGAWDSSAFVLSAFSTHSPVLSAAVAGSFRVGSIVPEPSALALAASSLGWTFLSGYFIRCRSSSGTRGRKR